MLQDDESEFDHFQDDEEFEGYDSDRVGSKVDDKEAPKITITKVIKLFLALQLIPYTLLFKLIFIIPESEVMFQC